MVSTEKLPENKCMKDHDEITDKIILLLAYMGSILVPKFGNKFLPKKLSNKYKVILIASSIGLGILIYFYSYLNQYDNCAIYKDPLNRKLFNVPYFNFAVSHWPMTHYVFFAALTYIFPLEWKLLFILGVGWEIIESLMKHITKKSGKKDFVKKSKRTRINEDTIEYTTYWDSSQKDIIFNSFGIITGLLIRKFF